MILVHLFLLLCNYMAAFPVPFFFASRKQVKHMKWSGSLPSSHAASDSTYEVESIHACTSVRSSLHDRAESSLLSSERLPGFWRCTASSLWIVHAASTIPVKRRQGLASQLEGPLPHSVHSPSSPSKGASVFLVQSARELTLGTALGQIRTLQEERERERVSSSM